MRPPRDGAATCGQPMVLGGAAIHPAGQGLWLRGLRLRTAGVLSLPRENRYPPAHWCGRNTGRRAIARERQPIDVLLPHNPNKQNPCFTTGADTNVRPSVPVRLPGAAAYGSVVDDSGAPSGPRVKATCRGRAPGGGQGERILAPPAMHACSARHFILPARRACGASAEACSTPPDFPLLRAAGTR